VRASDQLLVGFAGFAGRAIDEREHASAAPVRVVGAALGELGKDVGRGATVGGNRDHRLISTDVVTMSLPPRPRMFEGGPVIELSICGTRYQ
jgi:hypothetical protein